LRFLHSFPSLPLVTPQSPLSDVPPAITSGLAHGGPTDSVRFGSSASRHGWMFPKWIADLASIFLQFFTSLRPAVLAAALVVVCLLALPACAGATTNIYEVNTLSNALHPASTCATTATTTCSLYDAIALANANTGSTIQFTPGLTGTIYLNPTNNTININANMTIHGPAANQLTIDYQGATSKFYANNVTFNISGLTLANGSIGIQLSPTAIATIDSCVITGMGDTALVLAGNSIMKVTNSLIYGNSTVGGNSTMGTTSGGGIASNGGTLTVSNSTITGNSAGSTGGGIYNNGTATITNSTITGNISTGDGGGIYNVGGVTITNSIVAGNSSKSSANYADCDSCGPQSSNNLIGGTPPALGPLAWNGGYTKTMLPLYGSTVIGAGSYVAGEPATDQRGFPRPTSGTIDLGAVQTHYLTVNELADMDDGSCTVTTCSLRDALEQANKDGEGNIHFTVNGRATVTSRKPLPAIAVDLNIAGPGASKLTIDGDGASAVGSVLTINLDKVVAISGVTITNGNATAAAAGGGITSYGGLTVSNSVITGNTSDSGGGIVSNGEWLLVDSSTISGNTSYSVGGAIFNFNGSILIVNNSTLSGNTAINDGGGIGSTDGAVLLNNSTISGNSADEGGGINYGCSAQGPCMGVTINNSTISANTATLGTAGGIHNALATVTLYNSIVAGNTTAGTANSGDCTNCGTQNQYNFIGGNPELTPLQGAPNGTAQAVMIPMPGSPVIGAGSWLLSANGPTILNQDLHTDERGYSRPTSSTSAIDLGAVQTNYARIYFYTQPSDVVVGQYMVPEPVVQVMEANPANELLDGVNGIPVTLTFSGGAREIVGSGALTATTTAGGLATMNGIAINTAGTGYTFTVASPVLVGAGLTKVISNTFNVLTPAATPTFSPAAGTYTSVQSVTISSTDASAMIYYTTDGTTPTANSILNRGPITVSTSETIKAIAIAPGMANSAVASATYNLQVATPTFSPAGGTYTSAQTVTINLANPSAMIYYTTNGDTPTANSTVYLGPFTVTASEAINAIGIAPGYVDSAVASATYNLPVSFAVAVTPAALSVTSGQSGTVTVSVTPRNLVATAVIFSCSGLPAGASCSFSPASVTPSGTAASTSTLTVNTSGETAAVHRSSSPLLPASALAIAFSFFGWKKRRNLQLMLLLAVGVIGLSLFTGCGGSSSTSKTPVVSTITVTGTSGSGATQLQNTTTFSLTVN